MLKVLNNKIQLTRGDTMMLEVSLKNEKGEVYTPLSTDKIYFRVKKSSTAKDTLIEKEIPYDTMVLELEEVDTKDFRFGTYYYEVELVTEENHHYTAIANSEFEITTELESHG